MIDDEQIIEPIEYDFAMSRRNFVQVLGAGIIIVAAAAGTSVAQQRGRGSTRPINLDARLHIGKDGTITVMTGKVEGGQGSRGEITQAAAEELGVGVDKINLIMADTAVCPDDGITAGSGTTPRTLPAVRQACAAVRKMLADMPGKTYADLAATSADALKQTAPRDVTVTAVAQWKVLGTPVPRPNQRDLVDGVHHYPSDIIRPGMLYGKVLRAPSYGAKMTSCDVSAAKAMEGVIAVQDGNFVAVAAPTTHLAKRALRAVAAEWEPAPHPSSKELPAHLRKTARNPPANPYADEKASKTLRASYDVPYVQHSPMEPRAAVAEWQDGKLTVWTASQNPFGVRRELANALHIPEDQVRVIIPDFGGGFGGKHTGETAVEAARIAQAAGKPVAVRWTRLEEFTWAYFRPAAAIDVQATLDEQGKLASWHFININAGSPGIETPYKVKNECKSVGAEAPLRHGSYRALASTANTFARESFMDELAAAAGQDPLEFRLAHLDEGRLRSVLEDAAKRFEWKTRYADKSNPNVGVGLACAIEKGSFVAACAVVLVKDNTIKVQRICQTFECGAITNPANLMSQVQGAIIMGLGPVLREAMQFDDGKIRNASLWKYEVPRMSDVPELDINLLNRPDLPSAGAGETPLICVAPAIANAVFHATGTRVRQMPIRLTQNT